MASQDVLPMRRRTTTMLHLTIVCASAAAASGVGLAPRPLRSLGEALSSAAVIGGLALLQFRFCERPVKGTLRVVAADELPPTASLRPLVIRVMASWAIISPIVIACSDLAHPMDGGLLGIIAAISISNCWLTRRRYLDLEAARQATVYLSRRTGNERIVFLVPFSAPAALPG